MNSLEIHRIIAALVMTTKVYDVRVNLDLSDFFTVETHDKIRSQMELN